MADSQHLIANHILDAIKLKPGQRLLDIGGGTGTFARLASERFPAASTAVFDLPQVIAAISPRHRGAMEVVSGNMFEDPIPKTFDTISLVRILHDHDDAPVDRLLGRCFDALPNGGELIIAEPMAGTRNAESIGIPTLGSICGPWVVADPEPTKNLKRHYRARAFMESKKSGRIYRL